MFSKLISENKNKTSMDSQSQNDVRKRNGEVVINALQELGEPATLNKILQHIINQQKVVLKIVLMNWDWRKTVFFFKEVIRDPVERILERGVAYGFIQKEKKKYFVISPENEF